MKYEINRDTYAIIPTDYNVSLVYEGDNEYVINESPYSIMEHSCEYFGSSIQGRVIGSKKILGTIYKAPLLVEESKGIIFFPTMSSSLEEKNSWISLKNISNYENYNNSTKISFKNGKNIIIDIPFLSFENQLLRATRLESVIRQRQNI